MSDTESFISEVNDEVRRDRFYFMLRRYGWIAAVVVVLIVGGAAFSEYRKAQERAKAEGLGDAILTALELDNAAARADRLSGVSVEDDAAQNILDLIVASEAQDAGDRDAAIAALQRVATSGSIPDIYRQIASFKLLVLQVDTMDADALRQQFEALGQPGAPLALLAQEQLALLDVSQGNTDDAIARLQGIVEAAGVSSDLQQRAIQVIVSLGGTPDFETLPDTGN